MYRITFLEYEQLGVVFLKYVQFPIIKMSIMYIIKEHLGFKGRTAAHGGKIGQEFMTTITIHISWQWILDYPTTGYVVMEILIVVRSLVHHHKGGETLSISAGEDELCES